jgi:hypothetical protein
MPAELAMVYRQIFQFSLRTQLHAGITANQDFSILLLLPKFFG